MNQSKYIKDQSKQAGFTLLELLMVIAVIGILATIAVPRLQNYSQKAKFTEVINATGPYKLAVEKCIVETGGVDKCDANNNGIPAGIANGAGKVASLTVDNGKVTATGNADDFNGATYVITPNPTDSTIAWTIGGTCATDTPTLCDAPKSVQTTGVAGQNQ